MKFYCPICKNKVQRTQDDFPFCSSRCRILDLGQWASGDYRIAGDPANIPNGMPDDTEGY